jgi:hypothetical protein
MSEFWAQSKDGNLSLGTEENARLFRDDLRKNPNARYHISRLTPESKDQRGFFEGAVVPMVTFFQENMDHMDSADLAKMRHWLKVEFNGEIMVVAGKANKVPKSTKGKLNKGFIDRVIDWLEAQYAIDRIEVLNPKDYKNWRDTIFPSGGPDNYIDYLVEVGRLTKPEHGWMKPLTPVLKETL